MPGYAGQIGLKTESTWNTAPTVDKFSPFLSESIKNDGGGRMPYKGIRAGRRLPYGHKRGIPIIGGGVTMEFGNVDIATWLTHIFGAVSSSGSSTYTHTYTLGSTNSSSFACQVGRPDSSDTVRARTFSGCKINTGSISCGAGVNDGLALLEFDLSAGAEDGATALASASYTSGWAPFSYVDASVTKGGSAIVVDDWKVTVANAMRTDRKAIQASNTSITEQLENGYRQATIDLTMDFEDLTMYNHFLDDDNLTLVLALDNGTDSFTVTAKGYLTGESPNVDSPESILKQPVQFVAESATSDADAFTAVLITTEATAA